MWLSYKFEIPENQTQFIVPTNPITQTIYYNMRFLISDNKINPIAWEVSKIEDTIPKGIITVTLKQDLYDSEKDNNELMIADYYKSKITPKSSDTQEPVKEKYKITYSVSPSVKVGGSYKTFSVSPKLINQTAKWEVKDLEPEYYMSIFNIENPGTYKMKVAKDYSLIGKTFKLRLYIDEILADQIDVEVIGL